MKIYAKQVPPEYQESPLFMEEWPENVHVFGNRHYEEHGNYHDVVKEINAIAEDIDDIRSGCGWYTGESLERLLQESFPRKNPYTRAERLRILDLIENFMNAREYSDDERAAAMTIMELRDGIEYESAEIRGCCQGEWQNVIYPAAWGRERLDNFETEYFNTGAEWRVNENDPESDDNYYFYTHSWNTDGIRAEIAAAAGVNTDDVILYQFDGWTKTANYTEVK